LKVFNCLPLSHINITGKPIIILLEVHNAYQEICSNQPFSCWYLLVMFNKVYISFMKLTIYREKDNYEQKVLVE